MKWKEFIKLSRAEKIHWFETYKKMWLAAHNS